MRLLITAVLLTLLAYGITEGCRRRRRSPPPCQRFDCQVSRWRSWSSCSQQCGNSGTQSRSRYKTQNAQCGGSCNYQFSESRPCNRDACRNGGTPWSRGCSCPAGWAGTCCEYDRNECLWRPCQHYCTNVPGSYTCDCYSCYTIEGTRCNLKKCKIRGGCYPYNSVNPSNPCQDCNSNRKTSWTNNNALSCSDSNLCTRNDRCLSGACQGTPFTCRSCESCDGSGCKINPGFCVINGTCRANADKRTGKPCQECNDNNPTRWTANNNLKCSDNNVKTRNDHCLSGECRGQLYTCLTCQEHHNDACRLKPEFCVIKYKNVDTCFSHNTTKPGNPCQWCNASGSTLVWTNKNKVLCDDSNLCSRSDTCQNGQCKGIGFSCNNLCQNCNGNDCSLRTGYGYVGGKCTCTIAGKDYSHQQINPNNQCQWCNLNDKTAKASFAWSNRPAVPCNDSNACTKHDQCQSGRCVGSPYTCQLSYPQSSCIQTSHCVGDGTCRDIKKSSRTICRPASDQCDQPERCNGILGSCPQNTVNPIKITRGQASVTLPDFSSSISFQSGNSSLYLKLKGFSVTCGTFSIKWSLLKRQDACSLKQTNAGLPTDRNDHTLTGLTLQNTKAYKIVVQVTDIRGQSSIPVCTNAVTIDTSKPTGGWVRDGLGTKDLQYQSTKVIKASWGGFQTTFGIAKYEVAIFHNSSGKEILLRGFSNAKLNVSFAKTFSSITDGSQVVTKVRAYTKAGRYSEVSSNGAIVDTSPPITGSIFDGKNVSSDLGYANWTTIYQASWTHFRDQHTLMVSYNFGVQFRNGALVSSGLTSVGLRYAAQISGLHLTTGFEYCALIEGINAAGLTTQATSNCVLIDHNAPRPGVVHDGNSSDIDYQSVDNVFSANWNDFNDGPKGSGITEYRYKIEDQNGTQVTSWISTGLETKMTTQGLNLLNEVTYYITIRAIDKVGHYTDVKSDGVHIDITHPVYTGKINIEGEMATKYNETVVYLKSNTSLTASWPQFIDQHSGIKTYQYVIAEEDKQTSKLLWKDIPGGNILTTRLPFQQLNLINGKEYRLVIRGMNNAGLHAVIKSSLFIPQSTPPKLGMVLDGDKRTEDVDYQTNTDTVHATWGGFDSADVKVKAYYFGVGSCTFGNLHVTNNSFIQASPADATSLEMKGLHLVNGQRYCVKIKAENLAGIQTASVSSDGFLVDVTSPDVRRAKVLDGSGDDDIDYQTSTSDLSATWSGIQDLESGIKHFELAISRKRVGQPDVTSFINVGLNRSGTVSNLTLANDVYYVMVCAVNNAELKTCLSSDGVLIDPTSPTSGVVHDGILEPDIRYQSSTKTMSANWERIWDLESRIEKFEWGIGSSDTGQTNVQHFIDVGLQTHVQSQNDLALKNGHNYTVYLRIHNQAGGVQLLTSNGVTVDTTPPIPSPVLPGFTKSDWRFVQETNTYYSTNASGIYVTWEDFKELESELWYYKWSIGTSRCGTQILPLINIGLSRTANTTGSDVTLRPGVSYYVTVMARNRADLVSRACSPPMIFDDTPPYPGTVKVRSSKDEQKSYFNYDEEVYVEWEGFQDVESGIAMYVIHLKHGDRTIFNYTKRPANVSMRSLIPASKLLPNQTYRVQITCINNAGLPSSVQSQEFTLDSTPPIYTGNANELPRGRFESDPQSFTVTWEPFIDSESPEVVYEIGIGAKALHEDVQPFTRNGLAREFKNRELKLEHGKTYYVTVRAVNAAGLNTSLITEELTIDQTPPTGQHGCVKDGLSGDDIDFISLNDSVSARWASIQDSESGIKKVEYCVGSKPYNCVIKPFTYIYRNKSFVCSDCKRQAGMNLFARFRVTNAAGLSRTFTSDGVTVDTSPPQIGRILDGKRDKSPDVEQVDSSWMPIITWYGARDLESGVSSCEWQVVKHDGNTEVVIYRKQLNKRNITYNVRWTLQVDAKLKLTTNVSYFNAIQCSNQAGISQKLYSNAWSVVHKWPVTSYVMDGVGTRDLEFDIIGQTVGASWGPFRGDTKDPVIGYEWAVGTYGRVDDVMDFTEVELVTHASQSLSDTDITLEPGVQYYVTVKATSRSGRSSNKSSDGFVVDTTPPLGGVVKVQHKVRSQERNEVDFTLSWDHFSDAETGIKSYEYCLGLIKDECFTKETNSWMATKGSVANFQLINSEVSYYGIVFATNAAGLISTVSSSPFTIDLTPPLKGSVSDGVNKDHDYINSSVSLATSWSGFLDKESGVKKCILTVNEENPSSNFSMAQLLTVQGNGTITHTNLTLIPGFRYFSTIECSNPDGFKVRSSSDGIIVDDSPPICRAIFDGISQGQDIGYQSATDVLKAHWVTADDPESGVQEYLVAVGSGSNEDDIKEFFSVGLATEVKVENLTLQSGLSYYVTLEIVNRAGLRSRVSTNGVTVDTTPPFISEFNLQQPSRPSRYIGPRDRLAANWSASDQESDIDFVEFCVGTDIGQCRIQRMIPVPKNRTTITCSDCKLKHGETYFMTIRVWNMAGIFILATTEGITADLTPPISGLVLPDNLYMPCINRCALAATLRGFRDGESGIKNCVFSVKSSNGTAVGPGKYKTNTKRTVATNLSLEQRGTYQITVTCVNSVGESSKEIASSTVKIDNTPPTKGHVIVSADRHHDVIQKHSGCHFFNATLRVYWFGFYDNESDIARFRVAIGRNQFTDDVVPYRDVHIANSVNFELGRVAALTPGDLIFVTVEATNRAGLGTQAASLATRLIGENDERLLKKAAFECINILV